MAGIEVQAISEQDSHDLRESLTVIQGWLEVLFRQWDRIDEDERRHIISTALVSANQLAFMVSRLDGSQLTLSQEPIRLPE